MITIKLDQNGLRSSIYVRLSPDLRMRPSTRWPWLNYVAALLLSWKTQSDVSPKWDPVDGLAGYGSGGVAQRVLHECRDSALASATIDDLSSHCRHLVGVSTGATGRNRTCNRLASNPLQSLPKRDAEIAAFGGLNTAVGAGNEEGSGRVFRYTADEFQIVVEVDTAPGHRFVLSAGSMALEGFEATGTGEDCGRFNTAGLLDTQPTCGGTQATYLYSTYQNLPMAHHKLRTSNAFRADVRGALARPLQRTHTHTIVHFRTGRCHAAC